MLRSDDVVTVTQKNIINEACLVDVQRATENHEVSGGLACRGTQDLKVVRIVHLQVVQLDQNLQPASRASAARVSTIFLASVMHSCFG